MARSMAGFPSVVHNIKDITIGSDSWNLKVKVLHIWSPPDAYNLVDFSCLEMILIDGEGTRIEACLPSYLMKRYNMDIVEERLYHFRTFSVVPNTGPYKATPHKYKLIFVKETEISLAEPFFIPVSTLNVITAEELLKKGDEIDYVFDFVRLLTVVSAEQKFYRFGAFKRYICMEVIDHTAKMECVLYDEYVDVIQKYFTVHGRSRVIIVLQFVKLSLVGGVFFGKTVMQNMFAATRVFFNPVLTEVVDFRKSAALLGIDLEGRVGFLNRISPTVSMRDDFLILHPRKKICDLNVVSESFVCIIWAKVVKVINEGRWWYLECKCRKPVAAKDGIYHCTYCSRNVVNVIPRQVEVYDFNDSAYLTLDDRDVERILKKSCKDLLDEVEDPLSCQIPMVIISLVGKQWLFKVLKISTSDGYGDDVFKGLVEYKFIPLLRNCKASKHAGATRPCPINVESQSLCEAGPSGSEPHLHLKHVSRSLDCEFRKEITSGKGVVLDSLGGMK
ncbi:hypothetical protein SESBI_36681 [Sesbania bispinosa]|nr:hypothetical protein SESBI_36681 [Sesbania bispinosa]